MGNVQQELSIAKVCDCSNSAAKRGVVLSISVLPFVYSFKPPIHTPPHFLATVHKQANVRELHERLAATTQDYLSLQEQVNPLKRALQERFATNSGETVKSERDYIKRVGERRTERYKKRDQRLEIRD